MSLGSARFPLITLALLGWMGCRSPTKVGLADVRVKGDITTTSASVSLPSEAPDRAPSLAAARERESAEIAKENTAHDWKVKGTTCDPRTLVNPNERRDLREPAGIGGCPSGMAPVASKSSVCIDRWEASLVMTTDDGAEAAWTPYFGPGTVTVRAKSLPNVVPQAYVSKVQAEAACTASNKRLCASDEWIAACRGSASTPYPYGATERPGTCNDHRDKHPAAEYFESQSSFYASLDHPCIDQVESSLMPTGAKAECMTPEGVFDMVGNLHEWTADARFRGGYYMDTHQNGKGCDYVTSAHEASYADFSTGFRCCASTSPNRPE